jgi:hypothetical protein
LIAREHPADQFSILLVHSRAQAVPYRPAA